MAVLVALAGATLPVGTAPVAEPGVTRGAEGSLVTPTGSSDGRAPSGNDADGNEGDEGDEGDAGVTVKGEPRVDLVSQTSAATGQAPFAIETVINDPPAGGEVVVELHEALADRDAFRRTLFGVGLGEVAARAPAIELPAPAPPSVPASALFLFDGSGLAEPGLISLAGQLAPGVYPVEVTVTNDEDEPVAGLVSHLVRSPSDPDRRPLQVALTLPLDAAPGVSPSGGVDPDPAAERRASVLAGMLTDHPSLALTLDATPETVESLAATGGTAAAELDRIADALGDRQLVDRPYVRLPVDTWVRRGLGAELDRQIRRGNAVLSEQLAVPGSSTRISSDPIGAEAAAALFQRGVRRFVVPATSLAGPEGGAGDGTTAPFALASPAVPPVAAMGADVGLSSAFARSGDQELGGHRLLAELALVDLGRSGDRPAGVVFGPAPGWEPRARLLEVLLDGLDSNPTLEPTTVDALFSEVPATRTDDGDRVTRRLKAVEPTDLGGFPERLTSARSRLASYSDIVGPGSPDTERWNRLLLGAGSRSLDPVSRDALLTTVDAGITSQLGAISAPASQTVTLTAREASVPLTLRNELDQPVRVRLDLESSSVLEFPEGTRVPVTIGPGTDRVRLRVRAKSPGDVALRINVVSPDGQVALTDTLITVRSTAVSGIGVVLSIGAVLFLAVWWLRHWRRNGHPVRARGPEANSM